MRGLGRLLAIIMNATMIEKRLQKDIDDAATANTKFTVVLYSEEGPVELKVHPGELILVRPFTCPRVVGNGCLVPRTQWHLRFNSAKAAFKFYLGATTSNRGASRCFLNFLPLIGPTPCVHLRVRLPEPIRLRLCLRLHLRLRLRPPLHVYQPMRLPLLLPLTLCHIPTGTPLIITIGKDQGMGPGARLDVSVGPAARPSSKAAVEVVAADIVKLNPQVLGATFMMGLVAWPLLA